MQFAVGNMDEAGDVATQIEQRVHLHRRFGGAKLRPRKHRQAQIDGGRIQRIRVCSSSTPNGRRVQLAGMNDQRWAKSA